MKTMLLVLGLACAALADAPADGIYVRSEVPEANKATGTDGREVGVGEKCAYEIKDAIGTSKPTRKGR